MFDETTGFEAILPSEPRIGNRVRTKRCRKPEKNRLLDGRIRAMRKEQIIVVQFGTDVVAKRYTPSGAGTETFP